ncbi:general stress protein [Natranaerobius thermophilus]|uniref:General stress protein 17M-like domain-containing protein n=1 Tax=Natranaerobius thermophilus (strain ATCC BAA-1301 / DSM 18059 / JW/NM-WN-LF) TaxID=457570 RepID=B2A3A7_NATTJ|nr:general stress protein [Natranaerobius thermophilus]ACB85037.1 conserved hypothetical protein [Natranaerobius thermophilus JW/NM-WN-LF]
MSKTVVGVFTTTDSAESCISSMRERGFGDNEISLVAKDERQGGGDQDENVTMSYDDQSVGDGTATGGVLGGLAGLLAGVGALVVPGLGPIIAAGPIAGVLTGAVTGGVAGGLIDYGIPEQRGEFYESRVEEGDVLVLISTGDEKADEAESIMNEYGAEEVESHSQ